jgi:hypothetical protein
MAGKHLLSEYEEMCEYIKVWGSTLFLSIFLSHEIPDAENFYSSCTFVELQGCFVRRIKVSLE